MVVLNVWDVRPDPFFVRTPTRVSLPQNLLANGVCLQLGGNEQTLLDQIQQMLPNNNGGEIMFSIDLPTAPPQEQPMMVAQAEQAPQQAAAKERIMGVCHAVPNAMAPEGARVEYVIVPNFSAQYYFSQYEHKTVQGAATVTVLQGPNHGTLVPITAENVASIGPGKYVEGSNLYAYFPDKGYIGKDRATILVDFGGQKVKVVYFFQSLDHPLGNTGDAEACAKTGFQWKISQDANGNPVLTAVAPPDTTGVTLTNTSLSDWLSMAQLDGKVADMPSPCASLTTNASGAGVMVTAADGEFTLQPHHVSHP